METYQRVLRCSARAVGVAILLALLGASATSADDLGPEAYGAKVGPAIIHVKHDRSLGGGFIVDVEKGIVATSYRAIEGAKRVTIFFPADKDRKKKEFPADGYFAIVPGKDLALIHVKLGDRRAAALKLAEKMPEEGKRVFTFAMPPPPRIYSPSMGILTNIYTGRQVSDLLDQSSKVMYTNDLGFDLDAQWLYHSSTVYLRLGGEPVLNFDGEVVGMNVLAEPGKSNMHFAICVKHLRDLLPKAGKEAKPWSTLPPPRPDRVSPGDPHRKEASGKGRTEDTGQEADDGSDRSGFRIWTSSNGKFQVRAKYVGRDGDDVKLQKPNGKLIHVSFSKLSDEDRSFIEESGKEDKKGEEDD
jgi:hypothetical protein